MNTSTSIQLPIVSPDRSTIVHRRSELRSWSRALAAAGALLLIVLIAAVLRFYRLGSDGVGNEYYAATVQSMLTSPHNFFFAAYEPGGSVTVDKPPLGFWIQAVSAAIFGVNGFALALPQALAGVLSVALLFYLVRRTFGVGAGLLAALTLAITPVVVATERNNTIDGLLVFVLLLAAWAFLKAVDQGRLRYLLLGAFLVGLGFNIKMMQALLPLPAFYALYLFAGKTQLWRKLVNLALATMLLLAVSLSWAIVVDLTPPESRPYIGSSTNNTVMELILGHNGMSRLLPGGLRAIVAGGSQGPPSGGTDGPPPQQPGRAQLPGGQPPPPGQPPQRPPGAQSPVGQPPPSGRPPAGGRSPGFSWEIGEPGLFRLFEQPLVDQASWLLPLAAIGALVAVFSGKLRWPLSEQHGALLLWGVWLGTCMAFFSIANLFHTYYLIMLAPPLAALVGVGVTALWRTWRNHDWLGAALFGLALLVTVAFELYVLWDYPDQAQWLIPLILIGLLLSGGGLAFGLVARMGRFARLSRSVQLVALGVGLAAVMLAPLAWSAITISGIYDNANLPSAGPPTAEEQGGDGRAGRPGGQRPEGVERRVQDLIAYLEPLTTDVEYLVATMSARDASPLILATGRPVLTFGGFSGGDPIMTADDLAEMVADGELRYVFVSLSELQRRHEDVGQWIADNCQVEQWPGAGPVGAFPPRPGAGGNPPFGGSPGRGPGGGPPQLYMCG